MKSLPITLGSLSVSTGLLLIGHAALAFSPRLPPLSFLNYHVDNQMELSAQVDVDPVVRQRLAHHFHMTGTQAQAYVSNHLVLRRLKHPLKTRVYCITRSGHEFTIRKTLPTGTPVFVSKETGKPILKLACGNPLVSSLPSVGSSSGKIIHSHTHTAKVIHPHPKNQGAPPAPPTPIATLPHHSTSGVIPVAPPVGSLATVPTQPGFTVSTRPPGGTYTGGSGSIPLLPILGIIVASGLSTGGSSSGQTPSGLTGTPLPLTTGTSTTGPTNAGPTNTTTSGPVTTSTTAGSPTTETSTTGLPTNTVTAGPTNTSGVFPTTTATTGTHVGPPEVPEPVPAGTWAVGAGILGYLLMRPRRRAR